MTFTIYSTLHVTSLQKCQCFQRQIAVSDRQSLCYSDCTGAVIMHHPFRTVANYCIAHITFCLTTLTVIGVTCIIIYYVDLYIIAYKLITVFRGHDICSMYFVYDIIINKNIWLHSTIARKTAHSSGCMPHAYYASRPRGRVFAAAPSIVCGLSMCHYVVRQLLQQQSHFELQSLLNIDT